MLSILVDYHFSRVFHNNQSLLLHTQVEKMASYLANAGLDAKIGVKVADSKVPLPPASLQRFLRSKKLKSKIPGVVLADHEKEFKNKYVSFPSCL